VDHPAAARSAPTYELTNRFAAAPEIAGLKALRILAEGQLLMRLAIARARPSALALTMR
jgi:hypothetical protein